MRLLKEIRNLMGSYHVKSGIYHYYRNEFAPAVDFFHKALKEDPPLTDSDRRTARYYLTMTHMNAAAKLVDKDDHEAAAEEFRKAVNVSPDYPDLHFKLGETLEHLGRVDEAIAEFREAVRCKPDFLGAHIALAFCLARARRCDEASSAFQAAIELKIRRIEEPFNAGAALLGRGEADEAVSYFHEVFLSEPHRFERHFQAAIARLKAEDYEAALAEIDAARDLNPRYPDLPNYRGIALAELGRLDEAIEAFTEATRLGPLYAVPRLNLAFAHIRGGDLLAAERELERVLELDPTEPAATAKLEELRTGRAPDRSKRNGARGASA